MKKFLALALSLVMALSLVACGSPATQESPSTAPSPSAEPASAGHTADDMIVLAGARTLAPGLEDVYFSHKLLGAWEPLISVDESGNPHGGCWLRAGSATKTPLFGRSTFGRALSSRMERTSTLISWWRTSTVTSSWRAAIPSILHSRWTSSTPASLAVRRSTTTPSMSALPTHPRLYLT